MENSIKTKNIKINQDWFSKIDIKDLSTSDIINYCHLSEEEIIEGYMTAYRTTHIEGGLN